MKKLLFLTLALFCLGIGTVKAQFRTLYNFHGSDGKAPESSLMLFGNRLYGTTDIGGAHNDGCIFSIDTAGYGYKDLFDFDGTNGKYPQGALIISGKKLYGTTTEGGTYSNGNVFSIDTNGIGYKDLLDFNIANGQYIYCTLTILGNLLYGTTLEGGVNKYGTIFCIDTNGSGYKDIHDFNNTQGSYAMGSLTAIGKVLYGVTQYGGAHSDGIVYSINDDGSQFRDLFDFDGTNGNQPRCDLKISGKTMYGMTSLGGASGIGNIFSIDTNGSGFKDLLDFNGSNGKYPYGSLLIIGKVLYGMTELGGGAGNIFVIDTDGSGYNNLFNFNCTFNGGSGPDGSLISYNNFLYGLASACGANGDGTIFTWDTAKNYDAGYKDSIIVLSNASCFNGNNGEATVVVSGNSSPYTYDWSPVGITSNTATGLSAGTYTLTVTDGYSNVLKGSFTITQPSTALSISTSNTLSSCKTNNGYASVRVSGGVPPYSYNWSPSGGTDSTAKGLSFGNYTCTITDSLGCNSSQYFSIKDSGTLKVVVVPSRVKCYGDSSGSATAIISGGVKPFAYIWSPYGGTAPVAQKLIVGTYSVTVTDSNGCKTDTLTAVMQPPPIYITPYYWWADTGKCKGTAWVSVSGGTTPYSYLWNSGQTTDSIFNQCMGTYCCKITDANGCLDSSCVTIDTATLGIVLLHRNNIQINIYPNPSNGLFQLRISNYPNGSLRDELGIKNSVEIYNVLGEKVYSQSNISKGIPSGQNQTFSIDISSQPSGIYFYRLLTEDGKFVASGKLIKQ